MQIINKFKSICSKGKERITKNVRMAVLLCSAIDQANVSHHDYFAPVSLHTIKQKQKNIDSLALKIRAHNYIEVNLIHIKKNFIHGNTQKIFGNS